MKIVLFLLLICMIMLCLKENFTSTIGTVPLYFTGGIQSRLKNHDKTTMRYLP